MSGKRGAAPRDGGSFPMSGSILVLTGGVGGAKSVLGLGRLAAGLVTGIVNTGDDFEHLGLHVPPDIDTLL